MWRTSRIQSDAASLARHNAAEATDSLQQQARHLAFWQSLLTVQTSDGIGDRLHAFAQAHLTPLIDSITVYALDAPAEDAEPEQSRTMRVCGGDSAGLRLSAEGIFAQALQADRPVHALPSRGPDNVPRPGCLVLPLRAQQPAATSNCRNSRRRSSSDRAEPPAPATPNHLCTCASWPASSPANEKAASIQKSERRTQPIGLMVVTRQPAASPVSAHSLANSAYHALISRSRVHPSLDSSAEYPGSGLSELYPSVNTPCLLRRGISLSSYELSPHLPGGPLAAAPLGMVGAACDRPVAPLGACARERRSEPDLAALAARQPLPSPVLPLRVVREPVASDSSLPLPVPEERVESHAFLGGRATANGSADGGANGAPVTVSSTALRRQSEPNLARSMTVSSLGSPHSRKPSLPWLFAPRPDDSHGSNGPVTPPAVGAKAASRGGGVHLLGGFAMGTRLRSDAATRADARARPSSFVSADSDTLFSPSDERMLSQVASHIGGALARTLELEAEHSLLYSADRMVSEMLPGHIAWQLKQRLVKKGASQREFMVDDSERVAVLFSEVSGFEHFCNEASDAIEVVRMLNTLFAAFDALLPRHSVYKVRPCEGSARLRPCCVRCPTRLRLPSIPPEPLPSPRSPPLTPLTLLTPSLDPTSPPSPATRTAPLPSSRPHPSPSAATTPLAYLSRLPVHTPPHPPQPHPSPTSPMRWLRPL